MVDGGDGWLGGGRFFRVADKADDVLPPVDIVRVCRLTKLTGIVAILIDVEKYL